MSALLVAPCSHEAAKYAVAHWHYSGNLPNGKMVRYGAWESGEFIGAVIFARSSNNLLLSPYGLRQEEGCELVRVALRGHLSPVTQIVSKAMRLLRQSNPGLSLVVSFADPEHGHHGGIYQAGNWLYLGLSEVKQEFIVNGKRTHGRNVRHMYRRYGPRFPGESVLDWLRRHIDPNATMVHAPGKHRYVYPLNRAMRKELQGRALPYPAPEPTRPKPRNSPPAAPALEAPPQGS